MNLLKKTWINTYAVLIGLIASIVAVALYYDNIGNPSSYWYPSTEPYISATSIVAMVLFIVVLAGAVLANWLDEKDKKLYANICKGVSAILEIVALCLVWTSLLTLVNARVEGMGFIMFPDAAVAGDVVQFLPSLNKLIVAYVFYGIAGVIPMVGLFFNFYREKKKEPAGETQGI